MMSILKLYLEAVAINGSMHKIFQLNVLFSTLTSVFPSLFSLMAS